MTYYSSRIRGQTVPLHIYCTYLSTLSHKRLSEKKKITMVKPFARSSGMNILKFSRPPRAITSQRACRVPIRRILLNYLNRLRKIIISSLIYFISFFSLLPTRSPRNRCDRAPLTSPSGSASRMIPPPSRMDIFGWLLCKIIVRLPSKTTI